MSIWAIIGITLALLYVAAVLVAFVLWLRADTPNAKGLTLGLLWGVILLPAWPFVWVGGLIFGKRK